MSDRIHIIILERVPDPRRPRRHFGAGEVVAVPGPLPMYWRKRQGEGSCREATAAEVATAARARQAAAEEKAAAAKARRESTAAETETEGDHDLP